ncbi:MAG: DUF488 domain-containing protein [Saprospiraceae bacterium]|jgi:uncharacterized protein (DUF488 family)|nr:DUF488 domain-containing protein [Saprospiraceae bacterium]
MYYRRKIILELIETFGGELEKFQLQKLLMLFSFYQKIPSYHFVPYKYGCFSFQANADLATMKKYEWVDEGDKYWKKTTNQSYLSELKESDRKALLDLKNNFNNKSSDYLIKHTYKNYPYYAIHSKIAHQLLNQEELDKVDEQKPISTKNALFTIGYEGVTIEQYINKLIKADVKVLCDVRKNSYSMKYGFSKSQLKMACEGVGIQFLHIPEVGIVSDKRKELNTQKDYDLLFEDYVKTVIPKTLSEQEMILNLINEHHRVAITCFEKDICQCHRKHLAEAICQLPEFDYELIHL